MRKTKFNPVILSILLFCESPDARDREVMEEVNENNRTFTSARLKIEVLKEIFFSSNPSHLENCELDSELEEYALTPQTTGQKKFMKVDTRQIDEEWMERYVEGLDPLRQFALLDDVNFKVALAEGTEQTEIEVEKIDWRQRVPVVRGVSYVDKKTGARMQLQLSFAGDEEERKVSLLIKRPDGSVNERVIDVPSEEIKRQIIDETSQARSRMYNMVALQAVSTMGLSPLVIALGTIEGSIVTALIGMGCFLMTGVEAIMAGHGKIDEIIKRIYTKRYKSRLENLSAQNLSDKEHMIPHRTFKTLERIFSKY